MSKVKSKKTQRVAEWLQRQLSRLIQSEITDPRLTSFITITGVNLAADFGYAKVYFTIFTGNKSEVASVLNHASGHLRSLLARTSKCYTVPQLHFIYDDFIEYGMRLSKLIDEAILPINKKNII